MYSEDQHRAEEEVHELDHPVEEDLPTELFEEIVDSPPLVVQQQLTELLRIAESLPLVLQQQLTELLRKVQALEAKPPAPAGGSSKTVRCKLTAPSPHHTQRNMQTLNMQYL